LSNFLRFEDVEHFRFGSDFISVEGARDRFKMKKCPPDQIAALGNAIRDGIDHRLSAIASRGYCGEGVALDPLFATNRETH